MTEVFYPSPDNPDLANKQGEATMNASKTAVTNRDHPIVGPASSVDAGFEYIVKGPIQFENSGSITRNDENGV